MNPEWLANSVAAALAHRLRFQSSRRRSATSNAIRKKEAGHTEWFLCVRYCRIPDCQVAQECLLATRIMGYLSLSQQLSILGGPGSSASAVSTRL